MEKIANFVYNKSKPIIVTVIIINIAAIASFFRFDLSTDFLSFFTQGNPRAEEYHQLNEKYQIGEIISILVEQDNSMLTKENLRTVFVFNNVSQGYICVYSQEKDMLGKILKVS